MADKHYPKIILALGGGGARGFAHIGLLQVFLENGIPIDGIVGTSMGALVGSTYSVRTDIYYLGRLVEYLSWEDLIDIKIPRLGLVNGSKVQSLIDLLTKGKNFEDTFIDFWAVATDLHTGEAVVFKEGSLASAIRASISIPGVFTPIELNGKTLVDGAVVAGVPVKIAKEMEGDLTIGVNVGFDHTQHCIKNIFDVMSKVMDIMGNQLDSVQLPAADLIITPKLGNIGTMDFGRANECIEIGRKAAEDAIPHIQSLIDRHLAERDQVS